MRAGTLRHRITMQSKINTADSMGGKAETWAAIADGEIWAAVVPSGGRETFKYGQLWPTMTHKIQIRYKSCINTKMRVLFGDRVFKILSIVNVEERSIMLDLVCEEEPTGDT